MFGERTLTVALRSGVLVALVLTTASLMGAKRSNAPEVVDVFAAIEKGQIAVQFIPRDSKQCRLLIENKTDKPLGVALPAAFAGVPVLAQDFGWPPDGNNNNKQQQAPQRVGSGILGQNGNQGNQNQGNQNLFNVPNQRGNQQNPFQVFNIPPEKVAKLKFKTVCLEHGKPEPAPRFKYELRPLAKVTDKAGVREICSMLGQGKVNQRTAQLAAWHLNNGLSWEKLAGMREKASIGTTPRYTSEELEAGKRAAKEALAEAERRKPPTPSGQASTAGR